MERRQVALYVALALVGGFAAGFVTSKYATTTGNQQKPLAGTSREAATLAGAAVVTDTKDTPNQDFHRVTRIVRADIIEVEDVGPVQMIGIETPDGKGPKEIYGRYAEKSLAFAQSSLVGQKVRLEFDTANAATGNKGTAGQTLAYVYTQDGTLFNGEMIRQGHAFLRDIESFRRIDEFRAFEREAMQAMRGIWGSSSPNPANPMVASTNQPPTSTSPTTRDEKSKKISPLLPSDLGPNVPAMSGPVSPSEQSVFVSGADRTYHRVTCEFLGKKHQAISLSQAKAESYTACSRCFASTVMKAR
jgi:endonuclease YncB( thermonuclease family)